jgi:hypothetical protein
MNKNKQIQTKKPILKKWWFWVIVVLVLIIILPELPEQKIDINTAPEKNKQEY